ncbi:MAG: EthD domain-containing protein [Acidimicrobiales bacterium]
MLELVGLGSDRATAEVAAEATGATVYVKHRDEGDARPYATMIRAATDRIEAVREAADVALFVCFARAIKDEPRPLPPDRVIGSFPLVAHPDLTHRQADDHWRDVHGPLALASHSAMCDYTQLSVVATLSGRALDGIALCAFENRDDLRTKFFNDEDARAAIEADVATFADLRRSPRRVVLTQL